MDGKRPRGDDATTRQPHDGGGETESRPLLTNGARLHGGRFLIQRRLGEGGMGVVFEALDQASGGRVALKTLSRVDAAGIYHMKREFRSLADVVHPNLVTLHELVAEDDLWFFTMDLVEGEPFGQGGLPLGQLSQGPGSERETMRATHTSVRERPPQADAALPTPVRDLGALRIALMQLVDGVCAIHAAGKLHRDLKPSNVLVAPGPSVRILDFGLTSEASQPGAPQTIERGVHGTPAYMAPEQAQGGPVSAASDWYSVGVMLYEALTGRLPFDGSTFEVLLAKQQRDAEPVAALRPDAPAELSQLCDRLLARDPRDRPDAEEIARVVAAGGPAPHEAAASLPRARQAPTVPLGGWPSTRASERGRPAPTLPPPNACHEPFVGRAHELVSLERALSDTNLGKPVVALVRGPSGIGKTTFVEHFACHSQARADTLVLAGRCYRRESVPFKGLDGVIDALTRYLVRLPRPEAARLVPRHAQALARVFPVLGRVAAIAEAPQRRGLPNDVVELRYRAFDALKELLAVLAEQRPVIVTIDDLQWSDHDSARLLKHLLTPPDPPMLLLIATHREDETQAEGLRSLEQALAADSGGVDVRRLGLGALSPEESAQLARELVGEGEAERVSRIVQEASGNPLFIGELASASRQLGPTPGLRETILERIASLPPADREFMEALCAAGRPTRPEILAGVVARDGVEASARALMGGRLVRELAGDGDTPGMLASYHDRIRETVLGAMPQATLAAWHRRFVVQLEKAEEPDFERLAEHAFGARDDQAGGRYALLAARRAVEALAFHRAVGLFETALAHIQAEGTRLSDLLAELAHAQVGAGRCASAARTFLRAAAADPDRRQEFERSAGEQFLISGDLDRGAQLLRQTLAKAGLNYDDGLLDSAGAMPAYQALVASGFEFEPRAADAVDPRLLTRLDTLWAAALGLAYIYNAVPLLLAYAQEALRVGEPFRVARGRALLFVSFEVAIDQAGARARLPELLQLLSALDTPAARAWAALCEGAFGFWSGARDLGLSDLRRAEELLCDGGCVGMTRELSICRLLELGALGWRSAALAMQEPGLRYLRMADDNGDRMFASRVRACTYWGLSEERDAAHVRGEIQRGMDFVAGFQPSLAHSEGLMALVMVDASHGDFERALERTTEALAPMGGRWLFGLINRMMRCIVLLAAARETEDRAALLERVERDTSVIQQPLSMLGTPVHYPVLDGVSDFLEAQLAAARGQRTRALRKMERAARTIDPKAHLSVYARKRYGELLGSKRGAGMVAQARADLPSFGYRDPDRHFALWAPRFEDD